MAAAVALAPVVLLLALLVVRVRQMWRLTASSTRPWASPSAGPDSAGVREPRRPLVPSGVASAALPLPEPEPEPAATPIPVRLRRPRPAPGSPGFSGAA